MMPFIYDQPTQQAFWRRLLWHATTGAGWIFWMYLWIPFLRAITPKLNMAPRHANVAMRTPQELLMPFLTHTRMLALLVSVCLTWALLQQWRHRTHEHTPGTAAMSIGSLAQSIGLSEDDLLTWQQAQCMLVTHDEQLGWIHHVEILSADHAAVYA